MVYKKDTKIFNKFISIVLPTEYPIKPPHLFFITPNGRFQVNRKICLSISGHHPGILIY